MDCISIHVLTCITLHQTISTNYISASVILELQPCTPSAMLPLGFFPFPGPHLRYRVETIGKSDSSTLIQRNSTHSVLRTCPSDNRKYCQRPHTASPTFGDSFLFVNVTTQTPTYSSSPYLFVTLDNDNVGWIDLLVRSEEMQDQTNLMTPCFAEESIPTLSSLVKKYRLLKIMAPTWSLIFTSSNSQRFEIITEVTIGCIRNSKGRACMFACLTIFFRRSAQYLLSALGKYTEIEISYNHDPPNKVPPTIST